MEDYLSSSSEDEVFVSDSSDDFLFFGSSEEEEEVYDINKPGSSGLNTKWKEKFQKDNYVDARYFKKWYIVQVLGSSEIKDNSGVTIYFNLKFTEIKGENKFS